jgi:hypothetical protein
MGAGLICLNVAPRVTVHRSDGGVLGGPADVTWIPIPNTHRGLLPDRFPEGSANPGHHMALIIFTVSSTSICPPSGPTTLL